MDYVLRVIDGTAFIFKKDGTELTSDEYMEIRQPVARAYMNMKRREAKAVLEEACKQATWVFPQSRLDTRKSGACIYFVTADDRPNQIKIGYSNKLGQRLTALRHLVEEPKAYAFVKSTTPKLLELGFHEFFSSENVHGEWFNAAPIKTFIEQFRQV